MQHISEPRLLSLQAQEFLQKGLAMEPVLIKDVGEMTNLIRTDGQVRVLCTTQRFMKELCRLLYIDLRVIQRSVKDKLHKKQLLPVPLSFQMVYIPFRICSGDISIKTRGFLWIHHRHIKQVEEDKTNPARTMLVMSNGSTFCVPYSVHFVRRQIQDAFLIDFMLQEKRLPGPQDQPSPYIPTPHSIEILHQQLLQIAEVLRHYPI